MAQELFDQFRLTLLEQHINVYGVHVWMKNRREEECRFRADDTVNIHSASKSVTALAVAFCEQEGRLSLDDRVLSFFPQYKAAAAAGSEEITLRHLLHMQSGKAPGMWFRDRLSGKELLETDWAELFFKEPMTHAPGTFFSYSNQSTYMLMRVVEAVTGERAVDYLNPRLFWPLGIYNPCWHTCPGGHCMGATDLHLKTRELARIGQLYMEKGMFGQKRLLNADYFERAVSDTVQTNNAWLSDPETASGYGYQIWMGSDGGWRIDGKYGQYCIGFPELQAVVTLTSHEESRTYDIIRAVRRDIAPRLAWTSGT